MGAGFVRAYPTPTAAAALTEAQWTQWAREHRLSSPRIAELWGILQGPQLPVPAHVVRVNARLAAALLEQLAVAITTVQTYREASADFFASMPAADWARTLPGGRSGTTVPRVYAELGDAAGRWQTFRHLQGHAGSVPVTDTSGKHHRVYFRFACNMHLRDALHQFAFQSLGTSEWAPAYYARCRQRGHSHPHALRALGAKWLKIIFVLWSRQIPYDEKHHLATIGRQTLRQAA